MSVTAILSPLVSAALNSTAIWSAEVIPSDPVVGIPYFCLSVSGFGIAASELELVTLLPRNTEASGIAFPKAISPVEDTLTLPDSKLVCPVA